MTVVDRLGVVADDQNRDLWKSAIAANRKTSVCWSIDNARWKNALYKALGG
jgi:hypothetical protein